MHWTACKRTLDYMQAGTGLLVTVCNAAWTACKRTTVVAIAMLRWTVSARAHKTVTRSIASVLLRACGNAAQMMGSDFAGARQTIKMRNACILQVMNLDYHCAWKAMLEK